jgi:hypothetical protein
MTAGCSKIDVADSVTLRCQFEGREKAVFVDLALDLKQGTAKRLRDPRTPDDQSLFTGKAETGGVIARSDEYSIWMTSHVEGLPEVDSTWRWIVNRKTGDATMTIQFGPAVSDPITTSKGHCKQL